MTKLENTTGNKLAFASGGAVIGATMGYFISKSFEEKSDKIIFSVLLAIIGATFGTITEVFLAEQQKK